MNKKCNGLECKVIKNNIALRLENIQLKKQIDLMAKYIDSNNYIDNEECQFQWDFKIEKCIGSGDCKSCIKQYFERSREDESQRIN